MIKVESIENLKSIVDVVDVIGNYIQLKKKGSNFTANCPFHSEKTPSFVVSPSKQIYHCFGCGVTGDSIKFLMDYEKLSYPEAIEKLANFYNFKLEYTKNTQTIQNINLLDKLNGFYKQNLIQNNKESCELLISFDLPNKAIIYDARLVHTSSNAILLLSKNEQVLLYPIETLLGRVIKQEIIEGYEEPKNEKDDDKKTHIKTMTKDQIKEVAKKRYEKSTMPQEKKEYDDKKPVYKKTDKKPSFKNVKPKKKGRTINIKALKKSEN